MSALAALLLLALAAPPTRAQTVRRDWAEASPDVIEALKEYDSDPFQVLKDAGGEVPPAPSGPTEVKMDPRPRVVPDLPGCAKHPDWGPSPEQKLAAQELRERDIWDPWPAPGTPTREVHEAPPEPGAAETASPEGAELDRPRLLANDGFSEDDFDHMEALLRQGEKALRRGQAILR